MGAALSNRARHDTYALAAFLVMSLVLHAAAWALRPAWRLASQRPPSRAAAAPPLRTVALSPAQRSMVEQARRRRAAPPPAKAPPLPRGQVVELPADAPQAAQPDPQAEYLAERASRVARQTRARNTALQAAPASPPAAPRQGGRAAPEAPAAPQPPSPARRGPDGSWRLTPPAEAAPAPPRRLSMDDLLPQVGTLARLTEGAAAAAPPDALLHLDVGDGTFLNAREFKYAAFFNRMKRAVAQRWRAAEVLRLRDPSGQIYGSQPRVTTVAVTLDRQGTLLEVRVAEPCGLDFLDQAAVDAFVGAAPFQNPPAALFDGTLPLRFSFGFYLNFDLR